MNMAMGSQMMDLHFWILTILLFFLTMLQLLQPYRAASELISSHKPIVALAGDDVILPCQLQPAVNVTSETLLWTRPGLVPKYIHVHEAGRPMLRNQNRSYYNRTALFVDQLMKGNVSLKLFRVKLSDAGRYHCIIDSKQMEASVQLTVGDASSPVVNVAGIDKIRGEVVLQCESTGWYPEPEVFWLDGEGNLLSAGPTETVRGPDDLYTVSSRVTVEKRHSNSFTCRVQQNSTNQTRETLIHVPGFRVNTCNIWGVIVLFVIAGLMIIIISILLTIWIKTFPQKIKNVVKDKNKGETSSPELSRLNDQMKEPGQLSENQLVTF